jgi:hypothetical protein
MPLPVSGAVYDKSRARPRKIRDPHLAKKIAAQQMMQDFEQENAAIAAESQLRR